MPKNLLIFSDGTGQAGGILFDERRSNIYKMYRATRVCPDSSIDPNNQIAFYDAGLGSTPPSGGFGSKLYRTVYNLASQATGLGLTANIVDCYEFIIRHWQPGDRIFLFGFSRGAYTVRCLGGVLSLCGVPTKDEGKPLKRDSKTAQRIAGRAVRDVYQYTSSYPRQDATLRQGRLMDQRIELAKRFRMAHGSDANGESNAYPFFIGVFDTVASVAKMGAVALFAFGTLLVLTALAGLFSAFGTVTSFYEVSFLCVAGALFAIAVAASAGQYLRTHLKWASGLKDGIWKTIHLTQFRQRFYDTDLHRKVPYARHAISIDENRADFERVPWGSKRAETDPADDHDIQRFEQVWFAGVHSDVGGGYAETESRLSDIPLRWMVEAAQSVLHSIQVDWPTLRTYPAPSGMQHDQVKAGFGFLTRWCGITWRKELRKVPKEAVLHPTVYQRLQLTEVQLYDEMGAYRPKALTGHHGYQACI